MSKREKGLMIAVLAVLGVLAVDRYALTPLLEGQDLLNARRAQILADIKHVKDLMDERRQLTPEWKRMLSAGLKGDAADAESQLLHALRDWARESGLSLTSLKPERPDSKEQLKQIQVQAAGNATMDGVAKFLWKVHSASFPLKVTELNLGSRNDSTSNHNELALQIKLSTLYGATGETPAAREAVSLRRDRDSAGGDARATTIDPAALSTLYGTTGGTPAVRAEDGGAK